MQIISNDQTVRSKTVQDLKEFNSQPLSTQTQKRDQLVCIMLAIEKVFHLMTDDIIELSTEVESLKNKTGSYDGKCLGESITKLLKQIDDVKRADLIISRMQSR